jgi:hypothetical protein
MTEEPHDEQDIANLLSQLGEQTPDYPADLLEQRRAAYQRGFSALGVGPTAGHGLGAAGAGAAKVWTVENILKGLIAVVLLVEAAGGIALYRSQLSKQDSGSPSVTATLTALPSPTPTLLPTWTPTATSTLIPFAESTRAPHPTDPGHHLGQTPTPPGHRGP